MLTPAAATCPGLDREQPKPDPALLPVTSRVVHSDLCWMINVLAKKKKKKKSVTTKKDGCGAADGKSSALCCSRLRGSESEGKITSSKDCEDVSDDGGRQQADVF